MSSSFIVEFFFIFVTSIIAQGNYSGKLGYGVSPEGFPYDYSKFGDFLQEVTDMCDGGVVYANSAWRDSFETSGQIPDLQKTISLLQPTPYSYVDMLNFGWRSGDTLLLEVPGDPTNNWTNTIAKTLFIQMLIDVADSLQPTYLFIGNEISLYWVMDSSDYINWVDFYNEAYDSIKIHSPTTKIGTVFNYEHLAGTGFLVGWDTSYWNAFEVFDTSKMDILGLTVYPFFSYQTANEVSLGYLDSVFARIGDKPIVITETGWPADSFIGSWVSSPEQQVDYANKLFDIIDGHNVEVVNWLFLNYMMDTTDTDENKIFRSVAMRDSLGNDRPALPVWLSHCDTATAIVDVISNKSMTSRVTINPNPFHTKTLLRIDTFDRINVELVIYDILGRKLRQLKNIKTKEITITRGSLHNGIYFYELKDKNGIFAVGKIIID